MIAPTPEDAVRRLERIQKLPLSHRVSNFTNKRVLSRHFWAPAPLPAATPLLYRKTGATAFFLWRTEALSCIAANWSVLAVNYGRLREPFTKRICICRLLFLFFVQFATALKSSTAREERHSSWCFPVFCACLQLMGYIS